MIALRRSPSDANKNTREKTNKSVIYITNINVSRKSCLFTVPSIKLSSTSPEHDIFSAVHIASSLLTKISRAAVLIFKSGTIIFYSNCNINRM